MMIDETEEKPKPKKAAAKKTAAKSVPAKRTSMHPSESLRIRRLSEEFAANK